MAKQLSTLRTVLRRAAQDAVLGADDAVRAFSTVRIRRERVEKARLSYEQVRTIEEAELTGRAADARDWWMLSFYLGGARFGDIATLRWRQVERDGEGRPTYVRFRMRKTGDAQGVPLLPQATAILERWASRTGEHGTSPSTFVFGMVTEVDLADPRQARTVIQRWNAIARKYAYQITEQLGLPRVGFHAARHSLADHLRRSGVGLYFISKALGHANVTITEHYLCGFDVEGLDAELRRALG